MPALRRSLAAALVALAPLAPVAVLTAQPAAPSAVPTVSDPAADAPRYAPAALTAHQRLAREIYRELVEINTVDSVGSTTRAAEAMARRFRAAGFPAADVQVLVPPGKPTKGNLVVRYRGRQSAAAGAPKPILLLAHLDVVAANRADWPRDPFVLHEEGGYFLGRGTADDKAMAAIFVANLLRARRDGWQPARDLELALTADEEGGEANGVEYLIANHRPLVDAEYALNEGGGGVLLDGRPAMHTVQAAEKVPVNLTLTVTNPGGHSSVPRPDNAIYQLADALGRLARHQFPVAVNAVTRPWLAETAKVERPATAAAMRALATNPADSAAAASLSREPRFASTLRTSCVATRLAGGHAYNALPQVASANVNCRVVPTSSLEEVRAEIARVVADTNVRITLTVPLRERFGLAPGAVPPALLAAVTDLTHAMWGPGVPVVPTMSNGATDGRFLRAAGVPTFGVSGIFTAPNESNSHGRDEKLRVRSFYEGLDFLDRLVRRLAGAPAA
jgi:acetylornithine deacetylase/succinyl-diaminopimelate desuccinylase-like protein